MKEAYAQGLDSEEDEDSVGDQISPKDVGHNIYILAHQVTQKTLAVLVRALLYVCVTFCRPPGHLLQQLCVCSCICSY